MNKTYQYQVVELNPTKRLCNFEDCGPVGEFDNIPDAVHLAHQLFTETGNGYGVWDTKNQGFRAVSRPARNKLGQFQ